MRTKTLKPWQLVSVTSDGVGSAYIGEVVSMPTPSNTIMVRKVPGNPGLLEEVHVSACELVEAGDWHVHYACVNGPLKSFPTDMLRTDQCVPVSFDIEWENDRGSFVVKKESPTTMLIVAQVVRRRHPQWTPARWNSFGWGLAEMSSECFVQAAA